MTRDEAYQLLTEHVSGENLIRHCLAVEASMRALAKFFSEDEESWGIAGLLHDADWETTRETPERHTLELMDWLEEFDLADETKQAILAHNHFHNGHEPPQTLMEWSLYCCDELTGLIVACALVKPDKKLATVTVESITSKLPQASFAAGVDREKINLAEEKLGIPADEFIGLVLSAMQSIADDLSL